MIRCGMMKQEKFSSNPLRGIPPAGEGESGYDTMRHDEARLVFLGSPVGGESGYDTMRDDEIRKVLKLIRISSEIYFTILRTRI